MMNSNPVRSVILLVLLLLCACDRSTGSGGIQLQVDLTDPVLVQVLQQVDQDTLLQFVRDLSGEDPIVLGDSTITIRSRHSAHPGNHLAAEYIRNRLEGYGLEVSDQHYSPTGRNVLATLTGSTIPGETFILCAHYDSRPDSSLAPGADDNASGVAVVLEAARILSGYETGYSVVLAFWDEEEDIATGFLGSAHYAEVARASGAMILGVLNVDAIGWESDGDPVVQIDQRKVGTSLQLARIVSDVNNALQIGLRVLPVYETTGSDFVSFWNRGFGAIGIEEHYGHDYNPHWHSTGDRIELFNNGYFHDCARLAIITLAALADVGELE